MGKLGARMITRELLAGQLNILVKGTSFCSPKWRWALIMFRICLNKEVALKSIA